MPAPINCDVAIVGGGLAGGLIALALRRRRPDVDVRIVEGGSRIGGNHLWSFFASDVAAADRWLTAPLIGHGWRSYDVAFPEVSRTLRTGYYSIESRRLDQVVRANLPERAMMTRCEVLDVTPTAVLLTDDTRIEAKGVIDCRGPADLSMLHCGWQKFHGRELQLGAEHGLERPLIMDATVEQIDGYRFIYALPFSVTCAFVEDTYYSDTPDFDPALLGARIDAWITARGWQHAQAVREETGALPVVMGGDFERYWRAGGEKVAKAGSRAGLFHPLTSYSLPDAVRTATLIAAASDLGGPALHRLLYDFARSTWRRRHFYRMLAAMLFKAAEPEERYRVLQRFYCLDPGLIGRFYAGHSTLLDRLRVVAGKPPVPIGRAISAIRESYR